jgi:hypothetical protein
MNIITRSYLASACIYLGIFTFPALSQDVNIDSRAKARAETSVRVQENGDLSIQTRSKAEAESSVIIILGVPSAPKRTLRTNSTPLAKPNHGAQPLPALPSAQPYPSSESQSSVANVEPLKPRSRVPLPCKQNLKLEDGDIRVTIINYYCLARIVNIRVWRDGGKTQLQFEVDNNKGGRQAHLRMVERWSDLRGRAVADPIDEQRVAIEGGHTKVISISAPVPQAMIGIVTLYK